MDLLMQISEKFDRPIETVNRWNKDYFRYVRVGNVLFSEAPRFSKRGDFQAEWGGTRLGGGEYGRTQVWTLQEAEDLLEQFPEGGSK